MKDTREFFNTIEGLFKFLNKKSNFTVDEWSGKITLFMRKVVENEIF